jgi:sugar lactone lactonase YvrE
MAGASRLTAPLIAVLAAGAVVAPAAQAAREPLDIRVFARVGPPGQPEPVAVGPKRRRIFVGTNQQGKGDAEAPSRIFAYDREGELRREFVLEGQPLDEDHGIQGLAFDGEGLLYALDRSATPRIVRINRRTGHQRDYATFRDVPSCLVSGRERNCSATVGDMPAAPDYATFAPDGRLYVTDVEQALIWRVGRGGGRARVWFTDPRLENLFGPNGSQFMADGRTLMFAVTARGPVTGDPTRGALYTLPVRGDGRPGKLSELWTSRPADGPDGFAIARSQNIYLALAGANQLVLISPEGEEMARVPATPLENMQMEIPFEGPASLAFLGRRVLLSNQTSPAVGGGNPARWAIFDVYAGERGLPLFYP